VKPRELRRRLERVEVAGEQEARDRAWSVVRAGFEQREAVPRERVRLRRPLVLAAALALGTAAVLSPPGRAVIETVRDAVAGVEGAEPALFSLPAEGRLLTTTDAGSWVVHPDGSKRLLAGYRQASWSPFGRFVVAARRNELAALDPGGRVRWSLARPSVAQPRWGGTREDTRIAYLSGDELRVVAGDGTGDRILASRVAPVAAAWRPGAQHHLAYVGADGAVRVVDADTGREHARWREGDPEALLWSADGALLAARGGGLVSVYTADRTRVAGVSPRRLEVGDPVLAAAFAPSGSQLAVVAYDPVQDRSALSVVEEPATAADRVIFTGAGRFTDLAWSPDGEWLLVAWQDADQWLFIRSADVEQVEAVSEISRQFGVFPALAGWCCP
jgi:dipeptidyl aminopeptidase/acylaminoacyl peptidase